MNAGPPNSANDTSGIAAAVAAARDADVAVVFIGSDQTTEAENFDRDVITLAGVQELLVRAVLDAQPNTVVVLMNGGTISSDWMMSGEAGVGAPAILEAWYPGELGGDAIVNTLLGKANPGGKMPVCF
jgi:beta-glucosidase